MTNILTKPQRYFGFHQRQQQRKGSFPRVVLIDIYKSVHQDRHFEMDTKLADSDVGRNKTIQAHSARWRFRRVREVFAGKDSAPLTPLTYIHVGNASSRCRSNRLIPAYCGMCITMSALRREARLMRRNTGPLNVGRSASHIAFPRSAWEREQKINSIAR